jgi:hypothetical protein
VGVRAFLVDIGDRRPFYAGEVRVFDREGHATVRSVQDSSCEELTAALAFVVAVSIDPSASQPRSSQVAGTDDAPPLGSAADSLPGPGVPPAPTAPAGAIGTGVVTFSPPPGDIYVPRATSAFASAPSLRSGVRTSRAPSTWAVGAGVAASAEGLSAPGVLPAEAAFASVSIGALAGLWPEARLGLVHASSGTLDALPGQVHLEWTFGRLDACVTRWPAHGPVRLRPCARADAGVLAASARAVHNAQDRLRPWGSVGVSARLEWEPLEPLVLGIAGSLSFPLVREEFFVAPSPVVYQAPSVTPSAGVELGVHFP